MTTPATPPLRLPADMHYECIKCGRGCGEFWEIGVEPELVDSIRARPAEALRAAGVQDPSNPVVPSPFTPGRSMLRLREQPVLPPQPHSHALVPCRTACTLQASDGLCGLHKLWGAASKPNACQSFPFRFVETPQGTFAGLSFACTAVLGDLGPAVAMQTADLAELNAFTHNRRVIAAPPNLATGLPLDWPQYEAIEADLAALLDPAHGPLARRLVAQSVYLTLLARFLRAARQEAGAITAGPEAHAAALALFRKNMQGTPAAPWPRILDLAARRKGSPLLRRTLLAFAHALRTTYGARTGRLGSYLRVAAAYIGAWSGRARLELPALPRPVPFRELLAIRFDPSIPDQDAMLTRYFRHRLFRKDLLLADDLNYAINLQLLHWGLIHWYSAALAAAAGSPQVEREHLDEGLRNVEKYFVYHSAFDRLFGDYPVLRSFTDRIFENPLYAFTMANAGAHPAA